ncbi:MAG: hypothetical protein ACK2TV_16260 [Anaerolineales bacterium]
MGEDKINHYDTSRKNELSEHPNNPPFCFVVGLTAGLMGQMNSINGPSKNFVIHFVNPPYETNCLTDGV